MTTTKISAQDQVVAADGSTGTVISISGATAVVGWDDGARTEVALADLSKTTERHSGGHRVG